MKGFQIAEHAHPTKIKVTQNVPTPKCGKNDLLIDVHAAGLNFFDILQAQGKYQNQPPLPFVLGTEFAGKVALNTHIPKGCAYKPGDRVFGAGQGAFAETVTADHRLCLPVPDNMSFEQAAGLFITYPTSYEGLVGRGEAKEGDWVLVHAGAGGVGLAAVQIAKALGCKVIATASKESKRRICIEKGGADHAIDYTTKDWQKEVMEITGGKGVDVVYDPVGLIVPSLKCVAWKARVVVVGFAAGTIEKIPANLILLKNISVTGVHWGAYTKKEPSRQIEVWQTLLSLFESGKLVPAVFEKVYDGLEEISAGLDDLEKRRTWGKAVVRVKKDSGKLWGKSKL